MTKKEILAKVKKEYKRFKTGKPDDLNEVEWIDGLNSAISIKIDECYEESLSKPDLLVLIIQQIAALILMAESLTEE